MPAIQRAAEAAAALGEAPLWLPQRGELAFVDVTEPAVIVLPSEGPARRFPLPRPPAALFPLAGSTTRIGVALRSGMVCCELDSGTLSHLPMLGLELGDRRFNDGRCDSRGRLWLGMMDRRLAAPIGGLACVGANGIGRSVTSGITLSNAVAFSPDERVLYIADTRAGHVLAHPFEPESGRLGAPQLFLELRDGTERPDGCAVDAEGHLWIAAVNGGRVVRVAPDGRIARSITLPVSKPTSCGFGGAALDILFVTTARHGLTPAQQAAEPLAGQVLAITGCGTCGKAEQSYAAERDAVPRPAGRAPALM